MSEEKRPEWMSSISANVDPEDYLLGRKIDKTFELSQQEKAERAREARINLIANDKLKLTGDPILDLEKRKEQLKLDILSNPVKLRQLREELLKGDPNHQSERLGPKTNTNRKPSTSKSSPACEKDRHNKRHSSSKHKKSSRKHDKKSKQSGKERYRDSSKSSRKHKLKKSK